MIAMVERATEDDLGDVIAVDAQHRDAAHHSPARIEILTEAVKKHECYIAREGWDVIGFATINQHFFGQYFIDLLIVHPTRRRKGIATALIRHIEKIIPAEKLFTSTNQSNAEAQAFFATLGFVVSGWIDHLDEDDAEVIYFKRLHRPL